MNKGFITGVGTGLGLVALAVSLAGCFGSSTSKANQPYLDAGNNGVDKTAAITIADPDGFSNMSAKCAGHDGIYAAYHGDNPYGSIFVVPNDPNCSTGTYVDVNAK